MGGDSDGFRSLQFIGRNIVILPAKRSSKINLISAGLIGRLFFGCKRHLNICSMNSLTSITTVQNTASYFFKLNIRLSLMLPLKLLQLFCARSVEKKGLDDINEYQYSKEMFDYYDRDKSGKKK